MLSYPNVWWCINIRDKKIIIYMEDCLFGSQLGFFNLIHCILVAVVLPKCVSVACF